MAKLFDNQDSFCFIGLLNVFNQTCQNVYCRTGDIMVTNPLVPKQDNKSFIWSNKKEKYIYN